MAKACPVELSDCLDSVETIALASVIGIPTSAQTHSADIVGTML